MVFQVTCRAPAPGDPILEHAVLVLRQIVDGAGVSQRERLLTWWVFHDDIVFRW